MMAAVLFSAPLLFAEENLVAMPDVEGRIDHLAIDLKTNRLFVAALGNNTVEVLDLSGGRRVHTLKDLAEPQGIAFLPDLGKLVVACGGDGSCRIFDGATLKLEKVLDLSDDADNVRYDSASRRLYVGHGAGALAAIDAQTATVLADIKLSNHPEAFEVDGAKGIVYVNVPDSQQIEVVDLLKKAVVARWKIDEAAGNFPMALDAANERLYVGCRSPARLLAIDTNSGKIIARSPCVSDVDDVFCVAASRSVIAIGGAGSVEFYSSNADRLEKVGELKTRGGARTGLFVPTTNTVLVAAPKRVGQEAALLVLRFRGGEGK
jgi:DNA-binding beta-propeller fold protein YncE